VVGPHPHLGGQQRPGVRPQRSRIVELCTAPSENSTVICADEPGPAVPRTFPPAPGWPPGGHRVKAPPGYSRGRDKARAYDGLRVKDGQAVTMCAPSRNSAHYQRFLQQADTAHGRTVTGGSRAPRPGKGLGIQRALRTASAALLPFCRMAAGQRCFSMRAPAPGNTRDS